jgi:hypothetical protein
VSNEDRSGAWSIAVYIVGTPSRIPTRSRWMIPRAFAGSKRGSSVRHPPQRIIALSAELIPKTWNSGNAPSSIDSGPASTSSTATRAASSRL